MAAMSNLDGIVIGLAGLALILIYTQHGGIGVSPDSIAYLGVARNIDSMAALKDYNLRPLVDFPVFYPLFLGIIGFLVRTDLVTVLPFLNGLLFAGVIISTGYLLDSFETRSRLYKRIILLFIAISPPLLQVYYMAWSETLFILLVILFITAFKSYLSRPLYSRLLLSAAIAAIACITRYAGITIIATGLMLILFNRFQEWNTKFKHLLLFGTVSSSLLVINLIHNRWITGSLTGPRQAGILSLSDNIVFYGRVTGSWLAVWTQQAQVVSTVSILILTGITFLFLKRSWLNRNYLTAENCFAAFFIVYTVFIIAISTLSHFEEINNRLLSPLFIPLLIALTSWIPAQLFKLSKVYFNFVAVILGLVLLVFTVNDLEEDNEMYQEASRYGIPGYTADTWKQSATARFLREHATWFDPAYEVYSNAHEAAYFNGGLRTESLPQVVDKHDTHNFFSKKGLYLIWFDNFSDDELIKFKTIRDHADLVKLHDFKDGDIFFIRPRHALPPQQ